MEMITLPPQNLMLISVFYHLLLFIGDPILLCVFKLGDEVLGLSGLGTTFIGHSEDGDFILYYIHECLVELHMGYLDILF